MRHKVAGRKLDRSSGHRRALFRNQVTDVIKHGAIITTEAKAKEVQGLVEKVITLGKSGSLVARREALAFLYDDKTVEKLFSEIAPRFIKRAGGYTRITRLGRRLGDGALLAKLELVE